MKLTRDHVVWMVVLLLLVWGGVWVAQNTEWVNVQRPNSPKSAKKPDSEALFKQTLTHLGVKVAAPDNLQQLPPPNATLILSSWHWNLFPQRARALKRWVENGGHLVVPGGRFSEQGAQLDWVPITFKEPPKSNVPADADSGFDDSQDEDDSQDDEEDDDKDAGDESPQTPSPTPLPPSVLAQPDAPTANKRCPGLSEPTGVSPAFGTLRIYATCYYSDRVTLQTKAPLLWALDSPHGHSVARVAVGRGTVTLSSSPLPWGNESVLEHDNALIAVAATQAQPGREVWLVTHETRPPLLTFLWITGAPAVLLGALALSLALWRGAVRFGPPVALLPANRRSVVEQIRGTAQFVAHYRSMALHAAQLRALLDAAKPRIHGLDSLMLNERAQAIAALTQLDADALARAMNLKLNAAVQRNPNATLVLLETARRRLLTHQPSH
jgi:hypothetical protein